MNTTFFQSSSRLVRAGLVAIAVSLVGCGTFYHGVPTMTAAEHRTEALRDDAQAKRILSELGDRDVEYSDQGIWSLRFDMNDDALYTGRYEQAEDLMRLAEEHREAARRLEQARSASDNGLARASATAALGFHGDGASL